jgi:phosphatidylserine/phosphatidylglycerophosphate/cardiolipin synthase-like enzyme
VYAASIETGYSPEGTALQLVLKTINSAQQEIRLMGYSFTSPEVAGALVRAKQRGLDVKVVLDWKANTGKQQGEPGGHESSGQCRHPGSHSVAVQNHARQSHHC